MAQFDPTSIERDPLRSTQPIDIQMATGGESREFFDPLDLTGERARRAALEIGEIQAQAAGRGLEATLTGQRFAEQQIAPFLQGGPQALQQMQALTGVGGDQQAAMQQFQESPSQRFIRERSQRNIQRSQQALGGVGGPAVQQALQEQSAGLAAQDLPNQLQRLAGVVGVGQQAATQAADIRFAGAGNVAELIRQQAAGRASGILGGAQAQAQASQNAVGIGSTIASFFSDENMKENVEDLDLKACYETVLNMPLKSWKYLEETGLDQEIHLGTMYQEAPECIKVNGNMLDLHDEMMLMAGALQYAKQNNLIIEVKDA